MSDPRPIHDRTRRRAFAAAAAVLVLSATGLTLLGPAPDRTGTSPAGSATVVGARPAPAPVPPAATTARAARPVPRSSIPGQRAAVARTRRFLEAYVRFEVGTADAGTRRALRRTTTPRFARELLGAPPRAVAGRPRRGAIESLELADDASADEVAVVATIVRGQTTSPLTVRLERGEGGWRVDGLG